MENKPIIIISLISLALLGLIMPNRFLAQAEEQVLADDLELPVDPSTPGRTEGTGAHFEIKDSRYLNIILDSAEPLNLVLESAPEMVTLQIESASGAAAATKLTLGGFAPQTTYHKYEDNYHNHLAFTTDSNGNYSYAQDLSAPHFVFIQPRSSTKFIKDDEKGGDCDLIGVWSTSTKTCTLTTDLTETIQIDSDNITLDGNNHTITGNNTGAGIYVDGRKGVTIRKLTIKRFTYGIFLIFSSSNALSSNTVVSNFGGIYAYFSNDNILTNNNLNSNIAGIQFGASSNNILTNNNVNLNQWGIISYASYDNQIYHNNFANSVNNAYDRGVNQWDNGSEGNYWSDYTCIDSNSDGIGDTPYFFTGGQDNYPFMIENGWKGPAKWSFAVITDLHIGINDPDEDFKRPTWNDAAGGEYSGIDNISASENLKRIVKIINSRKDLYNIKFVVVDGDIADSAELSEFNEAIGELNKLEVPWIPIMGNHDVWPYYGANPDITDPWSEMAPEVGVDNSGTDRFFWDIFTSQYDKLSNIFQGWDKADMPDWNPEINPEHNSYFQNFAFNYGDYHFVGLDFNARDDAPWTPVGRWKGVSPEGDLHNFPGGTWNWFINHLQNYITNNPTSTENIILFAHHPFNNYSDPISNFIAGFSGSELKVILSDLEKYKTNVWGEFSGHTHPKDLKSYGWKVADWEEEIMKIFEIPPNGRDPYALLVQIYPEEKKIDYSKSLGDELIIKGKSPIDLKVVDPENLVINKEFNEIPGAVYTEEDIDGDGDLDDLIRILDKKLGEYQIKVIAEADANSTDTYTLEVSTLEDSFGYVPVVLAEHAPISEIPTTPYVFDSKDKKNTNIIYTGDLSGQYSESVNLSTSLTDKDGNPLSNKQVNFTIGLQTISAITDSNGLTTASLVLNQTPGKYYLIEASFDGDIDYLSSSDYRQFEIKIPAVIDLDPNSFNLESKGQWFKAYIELADDYNVNEIDASTILFDEAIPIDKSAPREIGDYDHDVISDLMVKFNRKEVAAHLISKNVNYGNVNLSVSGKLFDRTSFKGEDILKVIKGK